jgi:cleavage and polyadenylation specificity factor subunit 1
VHATPLSGVLPSARFCHVHIDLVGPQPVSSGFRYCLTAIERYTRWPEALPLSDITAEAVAKAFVSVWVARFGCPQEITTDQGRQFEVRRFKTVATITGSSLTRTTAWHPACIGMIERLHRQLKAALMCHADERGAEALPLVLLRIGSAWKNLKTSTAELVYGSPLRLPAEFFAPSLAERTDVTEFASRLRVHIGKLRPVHAGSTVWLQPHHRTNHNDVFNRLF